MGLIREPVNVDFSVINRTPTEEESKLISEYIRKYKLEYTKKSKASSVKSGAKKSSGHLARKAKSKVA